jgi:large subunit ribosomal protein L2
MGKRIRAQRKGRGGIYACPSHRYRGRASHPKINKGTGQVIALKHDPGRTAPVAEIDFGNNEKNLIIAPYTLAEEQNIEVGERAHLSVGNILPIRMIPEGTIVYNVEMKPGDGGKFARAAGTGAMVVSHEVALQ